MASAPLGFSAPSAGFDAPLEMLAACHGRIRAQCSTLRRLRAHVAVAGGDAGAHTAAHNVIRYFDGAGRHHHEDEENDLFPALLDSVAAADATCLRQLVDVLLAEHRELDLRWQKLKGWLAGIQAGVVTTPGPEEIEEFIGWYDRHIAREEEGLLPMAKRLLRPSALAAIGESMRRRRSTSPGPRPDR